MPHLLDTSFEEEDTVPTVSTSALDTNLDSPVENQSVEYQAAQMLAEHTGTSAEEHHGIFSAARNSIRRLFKHHEGANSFPPVPDLLYYHNELYNQGGDSLSKTTLSSKMIAGAAAYEAVHAYERHKLSHRLSDDQKSRDFITAFAMAEAVKLFQRHYNRHATNEEKHDVSAEAAAYADYYYNAIYHKDLARQQMVEGFHLNKEGEPVC